MFEKYVNFYYDIILGALKAVIVIDQWVEQLQIQNTI